jgi:hypothetical protein
MKAKKRVKPLKSPLDLSRSPVHFAPTGLIVPVVQRGRAHPGVEGRLAGEARMTKKPAPCRRDASGRRRAALSGGRRGRCHSRRGRGRTLPWAATRPSLCCAMRSVAPRDGQGTVPPLVFYAGAQPSPLAPPRPFQIRTRMTLWESGQYPASASLIARPRYSSSFILRS